MSQELTMDWSVIIMTNKNTTVLETSVSADERQPNVINTDDIISDNSTESNSYDEYIRQEMLNSII